MTQPTNETRDTARASTKPEAKPAPQPNAAAEPAAAETGAPQAGGVSGESNPATEAKPKDDDPVFGKSPFGPLLNDIASMIGPMNFLVTIGSAEGNADVQVVRAKTPRHAARQVRSKLNKSLYGDGDVHLQVFALRADHSELL